MWECDYSEKGGTLFKIKFWLLRSYNNNNNSHALNLYAAQLLVTLSSCMLPQELGITAIFAELLWSHTNKELITSNYALTSIHDKL